MAEVEVKEKMKVIGEIEVARSPTRGRSVDARSGGEVMKK
jgi:hypothetical protein